MKVQIVHLYDYKLVSYYSVQEIDDDYNDISDTEFFKFQDLMAKDEKDKRQLKELEKMISNMGKFDGAIFDYFKRENSFERLPPPDYKFFDSDGITDFGLRLFCIRVSDEIVILLNGGRKTTQRAQDCKNCGDNFAFTNKLSNAFYDAKYLGDLRVSGRDIDFEDDFYLEINHVR